MPKLPVVSGKQIIKALGKIGFEKVSQKGSHIKLQRVTRRGFTQTITVPDHKVIKRGTLRNGILRPIDISVTEFIKLLKKRSS